LVDLFWYTPIHQAGLARLIKLLHQLHVLEEVLVLDDPPVSGVPIDRARIYQVFPLLCPICGGQMRIIAFITEGAQIRKRLNHIGVDSEPPRLSPARGPPLWEDCDAQVDDRVQIAPDWDLAEQPAPDY
jgi:hypothetical protein